MSSYLLDMPRLAQVPHLAPETLHRLIRYHGLEACGELLTSATPAQLTSLLDLDLWRRATPGGDEQFDSDRFGEWLEVLVEAGESVAARTVTALDQRLVIAGLSRYLRVFDPGALEPTAATDDEPVERDEMMNGEPNGDMPECEVGGYVIRARKTDAWDAIVTLLVTLEFEHNQYFHAVMQGCRLLSNSRPEVDGLDQLPTPPEQHLYDVALERQRRRSRHGYATQTDARAFLEMARQPEYQAIVSVNAVATAYFRAARADDDAPPDDATHAVHHDDRDLSTSIDAIADFLAEAGVMPERPRALLEAAPEDQQPGKFPLLRRLMESVRHHDETSYLTRSGELAFLANTLLVGSSVQSRPFTPQEASDAAAAICNLGLECHAGMLPGTFLIDRGLVAAFEVGWSVLYRDVSLFVADQLMATLRHLRRFDPGADRRLFTLQRQLSIQRAAGTPWQARDAAEMLVAFNAIAWISVCGLLEECPILPAALTAVVEHRKTPVSPTAFEFISTTAQIAKIRLFLRMLPGLLSP